MSPASPPVVELAVSLSGTDVTLLITIVESPAATRESRRTPIARCVPGLSSSIDTTRFGISSLTRHVTGCPILRPTSTRMESPTTSGPLRHVVIVLPCAIHVLMESPWLSEA
jgi:hypothetical protein